METEKIITCPKCGAEYFPAELYYRDDLLGHPKNIEKTQLGEILFSNGTHPEYTATYNCDYCGADIKVVADIKYTTSTTERSLDEYITKRDKKLILEETEGEW